MKAPGPFFSLKKKVFCYKKIFFLKIIFFIETPEMEKCMICFEKNGEKSETSECVRHHCFHSSCLENWLQIENSCPICRINIYRVIPCVILGNFRHPIHELRWPEK